MSFRQYVFDKLLKYIRFFTVWTITALASFDVALAFHGSLWVGDWHLAFLAFPVSVAVTFLEYMLGSIVNESLQDVRRDFEKWKIEGRLNA